MRIFDAHCDALLKLWQHPDLSFTEVDERIQVTLPDMGKGNVDLQVFASFVPMEIPAIQRFSAVLQMVQLFHEKVIGSGLTPIYTKEDFDQCVLKRKKGAILFVEGAHPLEESMTNLYTLYRLGVRGIGFTWNFRNALADGCHEPNPGGLSLFGRKVLAEMNGLGMMVDVSHLAEPGFWDVVELTTAPFIASHSNAKAICDHPRNLSDEQIKAMINKDAVIGLTFVDFFVATEKRTVWIDDLLRHLDHVCSLGGVDHVAFSSDFDGTSVSFGDLKRASDYPLLVDALLKRYKEAEVEKFLYENWLRVFRNVIK